MSADVTMLTTTKTTATATAKWRADGNGRRKLRSSRRVIGPIPPSLARSRLKRAIRRRYVPAFAAPRHKARLALSTIDQAVTRGSRHAPGPHVIDLDDTYRRLAGPWMADQLDARYRDAQRRGDQLAEVAPAPVARPIVALAGAIPPSATVNVAIYTLHLLPNANQGIASQERVAGELINTIDKCGATALCCSHRALELDGRAHGYAADEWLRTVYDITGRLLESARPESEPPSVVQGAQDTISWLARALAELDQDSAEVPTALAETLARLLTAVIFADEARGGDALHGDQQLT